MHNHCEFIGNLGNDPEVRPGKEQSSFTTFSIAVNKVGASREDKPLWVNVTAFGKTGEFVGKYLKKGNRVLVTGTIELQEYEGRDGKTHTSLKLLAGKVLSLDKREGGEPSNGTGVSTKTAQVGGATSSNAATAVLDEDIPF